MAVTGASGLIGSALVPFLASRGHEVVHLVRRAPRGEGEIRWDPARGEIDGESLEGTDAVVHLSGENLAGPLNLVAPEPVTNREFTRALGRVLGRPTVVPLPAIALRAALGEMAEATLLASTRVRPGRLLDSGYAFRLPALDGALRHVLGIEAPAGV